MGIYRSVNRGCDRNFSGRHHFNFKNMASFKLTPCKKRHLKSWFINRIGQRIIKNEMGNLFDVQIEIHSKSHAIALYITQSEKNYTYNQ